MNNTVFLEHLARRRGAHTSARRIMTPAQAVVVLALLSAPFIARWMFAVSPFAFLIGFTIGWTFLYLGMQAFNAFLVMSASSGQGMVDTTSTVQQLDRQTLPTYAVLVPLYQETRVLDSLIRNLMALDYPVDRLHIILLLEADDAEMIQAIRSKSLPAHFQIVLVPVSQPRTKPKALNYGIQYVHSEFCVVYDAEDRPEPDQLLKAVAAFRQLPDHVMCLQAMLAYHNVNQNLLTRFFASEYSSWFGLFIPGMARRALLMVLGGTSNHFRAAQLKRVGAWDPFNVTEDADLGIRIVRAGYGIRALNSVTWEEANSRPISWVKQRSRWIKGYMQTYLVHMRNPLRLLREIGLRRFVAFQFIVGIAPLANVVNPIFWGMTLLYLFTRSELVENLYPGGTIYLGTIAMLAGNYFAIFVKLEGAMRLRQYGSVKWMLLTPFYWVLMSVAAYRAAWQLLVKPHYWEKTMHGFDLQLSPESSLD